MTIHPIFFYVFASLAIGFALNVILKKNPVSSAFSLVMVFFCFAGIYAAMNAHLIAALQVLVYAGAVMVLFIFVIMLLKADTQSFDMVRSNGAIRAAAAVGCAALLGLMVYVFKESPRNAPKGLFTQEAIEAAGGNTRVISELMFSEYILPFELTSALIMTGIVGAVAIAKRKLDQPRARAGRQK